MRVCVSVCSRTEAEAETITNLELGCSLSFPACYLLTKRKKDKDVKFFVHFFFFFCVLFSLYLTVCMRVMVYLTTNSHFVQSSLALYAFRSSCHTARSVCDCSVICMHVSVYAYFLGGMWWPGSYNRHFILQTHGHTKQNHISASVQM